MNEGRPSTYVAVVTGASRGIGKSTAAALAERGATVATLGRDASRNSIACDLGSFTSIRAAAAEITARWPRIDLLVNNAGVQHRRRGVSVDGIEATLAVNHLAPFVLTRLLLPCLEAAAPARVVTVSSSLARWGRIDFDDLQLARRYNGTRAYLQSKLANIMFTLSLGDRLTKRGIAAVCVYPGLVATDLLREPWWWRAAWLRPLWRTLFLHPDDAAQAVVGAATSATPSADCCVTLGGRTVPVPRAAGDPDQRRRLWDATVRLTGIDFPA